MSTKPIRRALARLNFAEAGVKEQYDAAMDAVRAIEEMARKILDSDNHHGGVQHPERVLLESIAKEAP